MEQEECCMFWFILIFVFIGIPLIKVAIYRNMLFFSHISGLEMAPGANIEITMDDEGMTMHASRNHTLPYSQIISCSSGELKDTGNGISVGGTLVGGLTMGAAGAIIGSRKQDKSNSSLLITYKSRESGETKHILLSGHVHSAIGVEKKIKEKVGPLQDVAL